MECHSLIDIYLLGPLTEERKTEQHPSCTRDPVLTPGIIVSKYSFLITEEGGLIQIVLILPDFLFHLSFCWFV